MKRSTRNAAADKRAFAETIKSARIGIAEAQYEVGLMYANGVGVAKSIQQAVDWVRLAAKQGLPSAQFLLATRFEAGVGVEQSTGQAIFWYVKAADQGHTKAVFRLGKLLSKAHPQEAAEYFKTAAQLGLPEGQLALAQSYADGAGLSKDGQLAERWYRAAAEQGVPAAQCALASLLAREKSSETKRQEAVFWHRKAAGQNYVASQLALYQIELEGGTTTRSGGRSKRKSSGVERRRDEERWVRAAESGNADARYHLGQMYELGLGFDSDWGQAERWYRTSAAAGHSAAQLSLARLLEQRGSVECVEWYLRAANAGDAQAQFAMGRLCSAGELVAQSYLDGLAWYVKAAEQGHALALVTLGNLCNADLHHVASDAYLRAAEAGSAQAQCLLARQFASGRGVPQNLEKAFSWYERAAFQGWAEAESALGLAYRNGLGVEQDFRQAFIWLLRAAEKGDPQAQWNVGSIYASGVEGVERNTKSAFLWCKKAAEQDFVAAQANLGILYALMKESQLAVLWWEKAAAKDDPEALFNLALALLKGEGVSPEPERGFECLLRAAALGVTKAQSKVGLMYATGEGCAVDPIEAHKWFVIAAMQGDEAARTNATRSQSLCGAAQLAEAMRRVRQWEKSRPFG